MPTDQELEQFTGRDAVGTDGKIGTVQDLYLDEDTGCPEWMAIKTGLVGSRISFAPLAEATLGDDGVRVPYTKDQVKDAPHADPDGALSQDEEARLYEHYGLSYGEAQSDSGLPEGGAATGREPVGTDVSGPETDEAMTRSEEQVQIGTRRREVGRVRLRKYVVAEQVEQTVPVQRETARVEVEPITAENMPAATDGPALSEEEHEVTLTAEEPVVEKAVVPKERVRVDKDVVTEQAQVSETARSEQVDVVDGADAPAEGIDGRHGTDGGVR
jgi:uncharacterized protein (TIGR02271 family)